MIQFDEKRIKQKEHIQRNARKYIGQIGDGTHPNDGIYTLLQELLNHFVDEFREGYGNKLEVQTHCGTVTIRDYGRPMLFEERYANSRLSTRTMELTRFGLDTIEAICGDLSINVYKDGKKGWYDSWNKSIDYVSSRKKHKDGLSVTLSLGWKFPNVWFDKNIVYSMLRNISYQNAGLEIAYEMNYKHVRIKSDKGLVNLLMDKKPCRGYYLYPIIHLKNEWMEIALTHSWASDETFYSFANGMHIYQNGPHLDAFKKAVASFLVRICSFELPEPDEVSFTDKLFKLEDAYSGMVGAIAVNVNIEDDSLSIDKYIQDFIDDKFRTYMFEHLDVCRIVYAKMRVAKEKRIFSKKCMGMKIEELVVIWNDGIDAGQLDLDRFYVIRDAFLAKEVKITEMMKANAIGKRLKISYDALNNVIHCQG